MNSLFQKFKMTPSFKDSDLSNAYVEGFNNALKLADESKPSITTEEFQKWVIAYRWVRRNLDEARRKRFPVGCTVKVKSGRYDGLGVVKHYPESTLTIAVKCPNENVWDFSVSKCTPLNADQPENPPGNPLEADMR